MLEPEQVGKLIEAARARFEPRGPIEVSMEANPDGVGVDRLRAFREAGVNRITVGLQSLFDDELAFLGRTHDARRGLEAFHAARVAGFRNICVDLIFGSPGQTADRWRESLARVVAMAPEHVSLYGLTVEPGTGLDRQVNDGLALPDDGAQKELYEIAMDVLPPEGWRHYEISNFARPGFESRHNCGYWEGGPYLGFGPGAHSYVPHRRWANLSNVRLYLERSEQGGELVGSREELTVEQRMLERAFLGLRRAEGLFAPAWEDEFGEPIERRFGAAIDEFIAQRLLERRGGFIALTRAGRLVADSIVAKFA
jgi:oxygen-independent coproporphyrinogen-3 oxidase